MQPNNQCRGPQRWQWVAGCVSKQSKNFKTQKTTKHNERTQLEPKHEKHRKTKTEHKTISDPARTRRVGPGREKGQRKESLYLVYVDPLTPLVGVPSCENGVYTV